MLLKSGCNVLLRSSLFTCSFFLLVFVVLFPAWVHANNVTGLSLFEDGVVAEIQGKVLNELDGKPVEGATVTLKGTTISVVTNASGEFSFSTNVTSGVLRVTHVNFEDEEVEFKNEKPLSILLRQKINNEEEVIVVGYNTKKRKNVTGSVATVNAEDIQRVQGGSTLSTTLAGKLPGVTFRMADARPGGGATIQIRNMGTPLYVIDGVQQDQGQFNNLAPGDIESISFLKDATAAVYGMRAANGVVLVTTKGGRLNGGSVVNVNAKLGFQSLTRFFEPVSNSYDYMRYRAEALMNNVIPPDPTDPNAGIITPEELENYRKETDLNHRSFNWKDFIIKDNAPLNEYNVSFSGGSEKVKYYASLTNLYQTAVFGREYKFKRTNLQSNINATVARGLTVGMSINGRVESRHNPGVPESDDYIQPLYSVIRNKPFQRPFANDNPRYLNDIGHNQTNWGYLNENLAGRFREDWRVMQTNFTAEYKIPWVSGLSIKTLYSYYYADRLLNNHEYTFDAYTYFPATATTLEEYRRTGGSSNPWRERRQDKRINTTLQVQLNYAATFGKHSVGAFLVSERLTTQNLDTWYRTNPTTNTLILMPFSEAYFYSDADTRTARAGTAIGVSYSYDNRYFLDLLGRRDLSYLFPPDSRVGYFPAVTMGWRITQEPFMENFLQKHSWLSELKPRLSYGISGDDGGTQPIISPFAYLQGYRYYQGPYIFAGNPVIGSIDRGAPTTNLSWQKKQQLNIGLDFGLFQNRLSGEIEYFHYLTTGIPAANGTVLMPAELGYVLPSENLNERSRRGIDLKLGYTGKIGEVAYNIGGNVSFSREKLDFVFNERFGNSIERYFNTGAQGRYTGMQFGFEALGQFKSQDEINNYPVDMDGQGNKTMLPGDLIYKDFDGDGIISDNDRRPIGWGTGQPNINFGFSFVLRYRQFDFAADFSGGSGYSWLPGETLRMAFWNDNNFNNVLSDRWHRENLYDVNSPWIPGKFPAFRFNNTAHRNNLFSDYWNKNVTYFRARTIELGYSLPQRFITKARLGNARVYLNTYNLFSFDNVKEFNIDPEITIAGSRQYPQSRVINIGFNLTFK